MLGYTLKSILELVPEVTSLVKQASILQDYPTDNVDGCLASALAIEYAKTQKGQTVPYDAIEKVAHAVEVYGLQGQVTKFTERMISRMHGGMQKQASVQERGTFDSRRAFFEGELCGTRDVAGLTKTAGCLFEEASALGRDPGEAVAKYSGNAYLLKEAALTALGHRFHVTKNDTFVKIAAALGKEPDVLPPGRVVQSLCSAITRMDKQAGLDMAGFDFYKETLITKSAAVSCSTVDLCGQTFPLQTVLNVPREHVEHYLGKDVAEGLSSDPTTAKAVVDSLPNDLKRVMITLVKS